MSASPFVPIRPFASRAGRRVFAAVLTVLLMAAAGGPATAIASTAPDVEVVVQKLHASDPRPEQAVEALGGDVERSLPVVDGFSATVPGDRLDALRASAGVGNVTVNRSVQVSGQYGEGSGSASAVYTDAVRASKTWGQGYTGAGIGVALIDTGVNDTGDLAGKVLHAVDFTAEQNNRDTYGHGTFLAGLIAGQGTASNGAVKGVAPGAHLVSVKIAGADGSTDLVRLLAGLEWVVTFKDALGIRVLNLAVASDSTQSYLHDPLNFAVQRVWNSGIVVVVAAGNGGTAPGSISKPGDDPLVVTVGASDDRTTAAIGDDTLAPFSAVGPTATDGIAKPDLVAPGKSVVSTRASGSTIDTANPSARVAGAYFKGSGTSASSAVTSGAAALVISRTWSLSPDQIKHRLASSARQVDGVVPAAGRGSGLLDAFGATMSNDLTRANQGVVPAQGFASLPSIFDFPGSQWAGSQWAGSQWAGSQWAGSQWAGSQWTGSQWAGSQWAGSQWATIGWLGIWS